MAEDTWEALSSSLNDDLRALDEAIATFIIDSSAEQEVTVIAPNSKVKAVCKIRPLTPKDLLNIAADEDYKSALQYSGMAKSSVQSLFELVYAIISINGNQYSKRDKIRLFLNLPNRIFTTFYQKCVMDPDTYIHKVMQCASLTRDELKNLFAVRDQEQNTEHSSENTGK